MSEEEIMNKGLTQLWSEVQALRAEVEKKQALINELRVFKTCLDCVEKEAELKDYREALEHIDLHFQRDLASGNFLGDDEHESWKIVREVLAKYDGYRQYKASEKGQ